MAVWAALLSGSPERESIWILNIAWCRQWLKYTGYDGTNVRPWGIHGPLPSKLPISFQSHSSLSFSHSVCLHLSPLFSAILWRLFSSGLSVCLTLSLIIIRPLCEVFAHYLFLCLFHGPNFSLCSVYFCCSLLSLPLNIWQFTKKTFTNLIKISKFKYFLNAFFANIFFQWNYWAWNNKQYSITTLWPWGRVLMLHSTQTCMNRKYFI